MGGPDINTPWTPDELLAQIRASVSLIAGETPPDDLEELAGRLLALDAALDELKLYRADVHQRLAAATRHTPEPIVLAGTAWDRMVSKSRKAWENDQLRGRVAREVLATPDGEVRSGTEVWEDVNAAFNLSGNSVRTTWLKEHGIDPDEYCQVGDEYSVTIRPVK